MLEWALSKHGQQPVHWLYSQRASVAVSDNAKSFIHHVVRKYLHLAHGLDPPTTMKTKRDGIATCPACPLWPRMPPRMPQTEVSITNGTERDAQCSMGAQRGHRYGDNTILELQCWQDLEPIQQRTVQLLLRCRCISSCPVFGWQALDGHYSQDNLCKANLGNCQVIKRPLEGKASPRLL